jgi:hypothetical protein
MLGGCSAEVSTFRADWNWWSNRTPPPARAAAPTALIGPDGSCAADTSEPRGIALGMTECDLVRVAGPTDQVAISTDTRGERAVTVTYPTGERAGIYRFSSGLLVSIDRVAEPERPQRPQRRPKREPPNSARGF